jgi:hypothetical protein
METALEILGWSAFGLAIFIALLLDLVGLFGNWIILAAMAAVWFFKGFVPFGLWGLGGMLALAVLGEILETWFAGYGAKRFGGSKGSMVAALVGCIGGAILGSPLFPILGTLLGAIAGAFVAAALYEIIQHERDVKQAAWTGIGAAVGKVGGLFAKLFCGLGMLLIGFLTW